MRLLIYLLHKKFSYRTIFVFACVIYLFTLGGSSYFGLVEKIPAVKAVYDIYYSFFDSIKNGVCFGMIFVSMGAMISEREKAITKSLTPGRAIVPVVLFAILLAVEEYLVAYFDWNQRGVDTVIMLVPFSYFFVRFLLVLNVNLGDGLCAAMRRYSILMFLTQRIPLSILELFFADTIIVRKSIVFFIVVLISTFLISFGVLQTSKKVKWLKLAY